MPIVNPFTNFSKTLGGRALSGLGSIFSNIAKPYNGPGSYDPSTGGIKQPGAPASPSLATGMNMPAPYSAPTFSAPPVTPQIKPAVATVKPAVATPPVPVPVASQVPVAGQTPPVPAPASGGTNPPAPATPAMPTAAQTADTNAEAAYQQSLKISPEELSTQEDLDNLIDSTKKAYLNTEGKAIPMEFITGQLKSIEDRATSLAEPLDRKLARLQSARTASLEASKFALSRADNKLTAEKTAATKAADDAESARRFDTTTKQSKDQFDANYKLSQEKFAEDKRQFGVNQAQENRKIAIEEAKATNENSSASLATKAAISGSLDGYQLASDLLDGGHTNEITGVKSITNLIPGLNAGANLAKNQFAQIKGMLSLENRQKMKGQGAVSDFEGKMLASAASSLDTNLSNTDFTNQLKKVRGVFATAAGMSTPVKVIDPKTRQAKTGSLDRAGIESAVGQGYLIEYQ